MDILSSVAHSQAITRRFNLHTYIIEVHLYRIHVSTDRWGFTHIVNPRRILLFDDLLKISPTGLTILACLTHNWKTVEIITNTRYTLC